MRIFLQSASKDDVLEMNQFLPLAGVVTTPQLLCAEKKDENTTLESQIQGLLEMLSDKQKLYVQLLATSFRSMISEARKLVALSEQIVVLVPATMQGMMAIKALHNLKIPAALNLVSTASQALLALNGDIDEIFLDTHLMEQGGDVPFMLKQIKNACLQNPAALQKITLDQTVSLSQAVLAMEESFGGLCLNKKQMLEMLSSPVSEREIEIQKTEWMNAYMRLELFE